MNVRRQGWSVLQQQKEKLLNCSCDDLLSQLQTEQCSVFELKKPLIFLYILLHNTETVKYCSSVWLQHPPVNNNTVNSSSQKRLRPNVDCIIWVVDVCQVVIMDDLEEQDQHLSSLPLMVLFNSTVHNLLVFTICTICFVMKLLSAEGHGGSLREAKGHASIWAHLWMLVLPARVQAGGQHLEVRHYLWISGRVLCLVQLASVSLQCRM